MLKCQAQCMTHPDDESSIPTASSIGASVIDGIYGRFTGATYIMVDSG